MQGPVSTINFLDSGGHVGFLVIFYLEVVHTLEVLQPSPAHSNPEHNSTTVPNYRLQPAIFGTVVCSNLCCDHRTIGNRKSLFYYGIGPVMQTYHWKLCTGLPCNDSRPHCRVLWIQIRILFRSNPKQFQAIKGESGIIFVQVHCTF